MPGPVLSERDRASCGPSPGGSIRRMRGPTTISASSTTTRACTRRRSPRSCARSSSTRRCRSRSATSRSRTSTAGTTTGGSPSCASGCAGTRGPRRALGARPHACVARPPRRGDRRVHGAARVPSERRPGAAPARAGREGARRPRTATTGSARALRPGSRQRARPLLHRRGAVQPRPERGRARGAARRRRAQPGQCRRALPHGLRATATWAGTRRPAR